MGNADGVNSYPYCLRCRWYIQRDQCPYCGTPAIPMRTDQALKIANDRPDLTSAGRQGTIPATGCGSRPSVAPLDAQRA
jgi:hypothetical protein